MRTIIPLLTLLALPLTAAARTEPALALKPCTISGTYGLQRADAECARLALPENPAEPDGRRIELHIAVLRARTAEPAPDPVFFIAGGPGQSAIDGYFAMAGAFRQVLGRRDIVLVDQRGTGRSNPLTCPTLEDPLAVAPPVEELRRGMFDCLAGLEADPRFYTTSVAVDDLDRARAALGVEQLNLYGISYGTRVALHYLREYPDHVRSVVLDGVVPTDLNLGPDIARAAQAALDGIFARCAVSAPCAAVFPDPAAALEALLVELQTPRELRLRDPLQGGALRLSWSLDHLRAAVRLLSYSGETAALLPLLIEQAAAGDSQPLAAQALMVAGELSRSIALAMHNSVMCTEDLPFARVGPDELRQMRASYLGTALMEALQASCEVWPRGVLDEGFKQPVRSDKPVLLLSGELDPVTPPAYAEHAARSLSNSRHIVAPGQGHGIAALGCVPRLLDEFYRRADPAALEADCVQTLAPPPFFLDFTGPRP